MIESDLDQTIVQTANEVVARTEDARKTIIELESRYRDAVKFLDESTSSVSESWVKWLNESKTYLSEVRTWRMAIQKEIRDGETAIKDFTQFLATPEIKAKLDVLRAFVEVAERFKVLKDSGFLDTVVETLLKAKP